MKVMLLAYEAPEDFAARENAAKWEAYMGGWYAFSDNLEKSGASAYSKALEQPHTATVVSVRNGKRTVEDGPFADTKEQLGGFFILETPNLEKASLLAAKCPAAQRGFVDLRPAPFLEAGDSK